MAASRFSSVQEAARFRPWYPALFRVVAPLLSAGLFLLAPRLSITGRHRVPRRGAVIFVANHISDADPPFLGLAVRRPLHWMAKRELWSYPFLGPIIEICGSFPVDPASPDRDALKWATKTLENGDGLVVFPEGQLSPSGELGTLLPGAIALALSSGAPLVPVGIWGTPHVVPFGRIWASPTLAPVRIHFAPRIDLSDLQTLPKREARTRASQRLEAALRAAVEVARKT